MESISQETVKKKFGNVYSFTLANSIKKLNNACERNLLKITLQVAKKSSFKTRKMLLEYQIKFIRPSERVPRVS